MQNKLQTILNEIKARAEKNLEEAKQLIQPEKSWVRDQQIILIQSAAIEYQRKHMKIMAGALCTVTGGNAEGLMNAFDDQLAHLIEELRK